MRHHHTRLIMLKLIRKEITHISEGLGHRDEIEMNVKWKLALHEHA